MKIFVWTINNDDKYEKYKNMCDSLICEKIDLKRSISHELDGKLIFSKPFILTEPISSIRELIKDRIPDLFAFLDPYNKIIVKVDEANYKLEDIIAEKIIKLQT